MNKSDTLAEIEIGLLSDDEKNELLDQLRQEIDKIDDSIINLLQSRAGKTELLGTLKKQLGTGNYSPVREKEIIKRVSKKDTINLSSMDIVRIFERIIDVSRAIQKRARDKE